MGSLSSTGFFNLGNLKFALYKAGYLLSGNAFVSKSYMMPLQEPLFSGENGSTLLFYASDLKTLKKVNEKSVGRLNENLNRLAELLREKGIELHFMPAPNKYSLYGRYLADNPYPEGRFFELLRSMEKGYSLIDTEKILSRELAAGVKDLYFIDDTHWTWKASRAIFEEYRFP